MVNLHCLFQKYRGKTASAARGKIELSRLFQKDQGQTASVASILSLNPTQPPLPCLLIQSFFYGVRETKSSGLLIIPRWTYFHMWVRVSEYIREKKNTLRYKKCHTESVLELSAKCEHTV